MRAIYIAGPMRGHPEHNYPAFREAAARLRAHFPDYVRVVSPVEVNHGPEDDGKQPPESYVRRDLAAMLDCDAIALLEGWQESIGARCEVAVGVTLNFSFIDATTLCPVVTPSHVPICGGYSVRADRYGQEWLDVAREIARARRKFPSWPNDPLHAVAVVGEEFGELTRAALQLCYEPNKVTRGDVRAEAVQLAAMAMRFLASFDRYDFGPGVQHGQAQP